MRKHRLLTATALTLSLGLVALAGAGGQAFAATTISTATTTPVKTSTTGDLTVSAAGSIAVTSGNAITVDSNNSVTLNGKIDMLKSADGSTGILVDGGHTGNLTISANITVTDDYTQLDTNKAADGTTAAPDGILEAPFSDTKTRYGIHSTGTTRRQSPAADRPEADPGRRPARSRSTAIILMASALKTISRAISPWTALSL